MARRDREIRLAEARARNRQLKLDLEVCLLHQSFYYIGWASNEN